MRTLISSTAILLVVGVAIPAFAQADPATIIKLCDTNNDGAVTKAEWDSCGAPMAFPAEADKNKDGKIVVEELATVSTGPAPAAPKGN